MENVITNSLTGLDYFNAEHQAWLESWKDLGYPNFKNEHFTNIVAMGEEAVPYIINVIKEKPDHVVHALDLIIGQYTKFRGYASLRMLCSAWLATYENIKEHLGFETPEEYASGDQD